MLQGLSSKTLQVDGDFAVDLFGELARAYLAAINTRSQVMAIVYLFKKIYVYWNVVGLLCICYSRTLVNI